MKTRHKVLIVDDESHIRRLIQTALGRADYATVEAGNARETMERLREERPDLVLLDLGLPDRDGLELVPLIKKETDATLIIVSARDATDEKVAALDLGADDYLTKPVRIEELVSELKDEFTIAIVTHNMQQAARVSDFTAYMYLGELVEFGRTDDIFIKPRDKRTEDYITGRFG